jgi:hypothetical protein
MEFMQPEDQAMNDAEQYFSRLHLFIPAQRKNLPAHMLKIESGNHDRRKTRNDKAGKK